MAANYADVLGQLRADGLIVDSLVVGSTRPQRCSVEGDREKRGWYWLHELVSTSGETLIVGSFGVWRGAENNARKVEIVKTALSTEQRESLSRRLAEDRRRAEIERQKEIDRAARRAAAAWAKCSPTGESAYLAAKGVGAHGVRFSPSGALVIPLLDTGGVIHGLQVVRDSRVAKSKRLLQKEFWPAGCAKKGHFHLLGGMPVGVLLVAEGYATAASLHEATGLPVAVAFDAGNIMSVAAALRARYKQVRILICADDDAGQKCQACKAPLWLPKQPTTCPACGQPHRASNAGVTAASTAAMEVSGSWMRPAFADEAKRRAGWLEHGRKVTDYNDLHQAEGLHSVRLQVEDRLSALGWRVTASRGAAREPGGAGKEPLAPIGTLDELLDRFALVYGQGGTVFDRHEHCLVAIGDMRDACLSREIHRAWAEHPDRAIVRPREVGFDPGGDDPSVTCNLWGGWPTEPRAGACETLLELLWHMCAEEGDPGELFQWVIRWLALPVQRPGAKMKTSLVIHGPQGTGKNMFFEVVRDIYGQYGRVIDQNAIEDKFNDWASRKLFLIADEVVARSDLYHVKNRLKAFITGDWLRINPKNIAAYDERNHVNIVFLSNETMPVVLEEDDRRYAVIWTPSKLGPEFYRAVRAEIAAGGAAALHHYLLHYDLGGFDEATPPPATTARAELINLSLDSTSRFYYELTAGDIDGVSARPALSTDVYDLYRAWCVRVGMSRPAPMPRLLNALSRRHKVIAARKRYFIGQVEHGPHGVCYLGQDRPPPTVHEAVWLGDSIQSFKNAVSDYRGKS